MALRQLGEAASMISPEPVSVIAFGSFARGEADAESDIDLAVVRADNVDDDDERWADSIDLLRRQVRAITGNDVEIVESTASEARRKIRGRSELWRSIRHEGVVAYGLTLKELTE
jgi:predicted nucleotidyltransferase